MILTPCFSTWGLLTTGRTSSWLHLLPSLAISAVIVSQLWMRAMTRLRESSIKSTIVWASTILGLQKLKQLSKSAGTAGATWTEEEGAANMAKQIRRRERWKDRGGVFINALTVIAFASCVFVAYFVWHHPQFPTYEYHNVKVLKRVGPNSWWIEREDGPTLWNGCEDFPNSDVIWAGYVMDKFRYEDRGVCKSILRSDLGVWWLRDPATKEAKEIAHVRTAR